MDERRRSKRISCRAEARVRGLGRRRLPVRLSDLSTHGACLDSGTALPVGHRTVLSFTLVDRDLSPEIEVVYAVTGKGMGVQFINLSPSERALIRSLVAAEAGRTATPPHDIPRSRFARSRRAHSTH